MTPIKLDGTMIQINKIYTERIKDMKVVLNHKMNNMLKMDLIQDLLLKCQAEVDEIIARN